MGERLSKTEALERIVEIVRRTDLEPHSESSAGKVAGLCPCDFLKSEELCVYASDEKTARRVLEAKESAFHVENKRLHGDDCGDYRCAKSDEECVFDSAPEGEVVCKEVELVTRDYEIRIKLVKCCRTNRWGCFCVKKS